MLETVFVAKRPITPDEVTKIKEAIRWASCNDVFDSDSTPESRSFLLIPRDMIRYRGAEVTGLTFSGNRVVFGYNTQSAGQERFIRDCTQVIYQQVPGRIVLHLGERDVTDEGELVAGRLGTNFGYGGGVSAN